MSDPLAERPGVEISLEKVADVFGLGLLESFGRLLQGLPLSFRQPDGQRGRLHYSENTLCRA